MKPTLQFVWTVCLSFLFLGVAPLRAGEPGRVLIIGDSMMRVTAHATTLALEKRPGVITKSETSLGSGLARLDAYDWMSKIDTLVAEFNPDLSLVWFGTNDHQPMQTDAGIVSISDPEWEREYAHRVGMVMDKLTAPEGAKVYWLELPVMRDSKITESVDIINRIAKAEADKRENVTFFITRKILGRKPGVYSPNVIGPDGKMIVLRSSDGIHLSRPGADRIASAIDKEIFE